MVKVYLSRKNISFEECNVSIDRKALKELIETGYRTTPIALIGQEVVVGYNPSRLDKALEKLD
jgi:glutaredoxin